MLLNLPYILSFLIVFTLLIGIAAIVSGIFFVTEKNLAIIERFGRFYKISEPGLNFKFPFIDNIKGYVNLQVFSLESKIETKTKDNVFVDIHCCTQYRVIKEKAFDAYYTLNDSSGQLESYIFNAIRGLAPKRLLDELFEEKDDIAFEVKNSLDRVMHEYGLEIIQTLITHIDPDAKVKASMNEINAAERERIATTHRVEAEKLAIVKAAEAQKESKILQGEGVAGQRRAIIQGLRESVEEMRHAQNININEAIELLLKTQYLDTIQSIGANSKSNTIFLNPNPTIGLNTNSKQDLQSLLETIITAEIAKPNKSKN